MKKRKTIMDSHELFIDQLKTLVLDYSMADLLRFQEGCRVKKGYQAYYEIYTAEIKRRKEEISGET